MWNDSTNFPSVDPLQGILDSHAMGALHVQSFELHGGRPAMQPTDLYTGAVHVDMLTTP